MSNSLQGTLEKRDGTWVLTLERDIAHPAERLWPWPTDPGRLRRWSPVVPDRAFDGVRPRAVRENPGDDPVAGDVVALEPPTELVHRWGPDLPRWRLTPTDTGCRLTLEHSMAERDAAAGNAGGWHLCLDVLAGNLVARQLRRAVGLSASLSSVEDGLDIVAVGIADERTEVTGVVLGPDPRLV
ncbi:MAG: hypothetical protein JWR37_2449 [Mycobacterium sp.]|jgi:uncharacterized protein YndB with AHSA1/START domain|nr:hypothetical protein [Mycobacterium sp.]